MGLGNEITIWQQNINKSPACQHNLISSNALTQLNVDVLALQEPAINAFNQTVAARDWIVVYPSTHEAEPSKTRSVTLIRAHISTDNWNQLDFPSGDVTVIQLTGDWGKLTIFNIYNDGNNNNTISALTKYHRDNALRLGQRDREGAHHMWIGDFNRHHPHWDDPNDTRLFTRDSIKAAEVLIDALVEVGLELALPAGTPTHIHNVTKRRSRLDQVFISDHSGDLVVKCEIMPERRGINTDHLPIMTVLNLDISKVQADHPPNFRDVDWEEFGKELEKRLAALTPASPILTQRQLDRQCDDLTKALQGTINVQVPTTEITPKSKRWWTKELTQLRKQADKLGRKAYKLKYTPEHVIHEEHRAAVKRYVNTMEYNKKQHWRDWLEKAEEPDIWTAHRIISAPASDGGKSRIPILKYKIGDQDYTASTNNEKSEALARGFFPPRPQTECEMPRQGRKPIRGTACAITREQVLKQLQRLKPYKAPGPDGIPNIVLTKCAHLLIDRLVHIYVAIYERGLFYKPWKSSTTVVLRKPGKPRYDVPKAYRPIALLNTMWKVLTAIVAEQLTFVTEKHSLLPENHFGGRPGRTTTDAMHLLAHKIKSAWRAGKVTAVLFLDIEGAFPNAVPSQLEHNMRKRGVPNKITNFVHGMLRDRLTTLRFDGFTSQALSIDNGIGQGDPLSMILYQYYNADLLGIPETEGEDAIAYVDDTILMATDTSFPEAHEKLTSMMTKQGGVIEWSSTHNSPLEHSKLALIDFAHRQSTKERAPLHLPQGDVHPVESAKYLGIIFDQHLDWKAQHAHALAKGTKWATQIRRLARPSWGITPTHARRLFISIAIPRYLYAVDVWCNPTKLDETGYPSNAKISKHLTTIQRAGTIAVTGGLKSSPTDALDAAAYLMPAQLTLGKWWFRALVRLATLPQGHPLHSLVAKKATRKVKRHKSPLNFLLSSHDLEVTNVEKKPTHHKNPSRPGKSPFTISVAEDRESSIEEDSNAREEVRVYSDGSAINGKVGAAAILIRAGNPPRILHKHLGPEEKHTVHEAELAGVLLALQLIGSEQRGNTSFSLGLDNQAAIKALHSDHKGPGHHIAKEIDTLAHKISKRRQKAMYSLTVRWTAGHEGIAGNELADQEAKKAAEGLTSEKQLLPAFLRKPLTTNPAAVKRADHEKKKNAWASNWKSSARGQRTTLIDKSTPSKKFLKAISTADLSREAASRISQFRLSHAPLNKFLKRIQKVDSARCPACGADEETIEHFLLTCPSYAHERWALTQAARKKRKTINLGTLLGDQEMILPLASYIEATHRFSNSGEQINPQT